MDVSLPHRCFSLFLSLSKIKETCPWVRIKNRDGGEGGKIKLVQHPSEAKYIICSEI